MMVLSNLAVALILAEALREEYERIRLACASSTG